MYDVIISRCSLGDIPDLINIASTTYLQHFSHLWHDKGEEYVAKHFNERILRSEMKAPSAAFFMIYYQNQLAGYLKLNVHAALGNYDQHDCLEVERIYLLKEATGNGVGQQVMEFVLRFAREKSKRVVWLKVMESSSQAIRFYEKAGFGKAASLPVYFPLLKEELRGMHVMKLNVPLAGKINYAGSSHRRSTIKEVCVG